MYGRMAGFAGPVSPRPVPSVVYSAGLYRTTYTGYFADVPSFFATATATATLVQTTVIEEPATDDGSSFTRGCLACELDGIIQEMYTPGSSLGPVMPHRFIHALWLQSKNLAGYQQHDAHEFFICCIDELSKACEAYNKSSSLQMGPLFGGSCLSSVTCNACGAVSGNEEFFRDISLDISGDVCDALTLNDCLQRFTRVEMLDADASHVCPTCHGNSFSKQISVTRPPFVLCLHLKRFDHDVSSGRFTKIDRHVNLVDTSFFLALHSHLSFAGLVSVIF